MRPDYTLYISGLKTDNFAFLSLHFFCSSNMPNQTSQIRVTTKNLRNKSNLFSGNPLLFFSVRLFLVY